MAAKAGTQLHNDPTGKNVTLLKGDTTKTVSAAKLAARVHEVLGKEGVTWNNIVPIFNSYLGTTQGSMGALFDSRTGRLPMCVRPRLPSGAPPLPEFFHGADLPTAQACALASAQHLAAVSAGSQPPPITPVHRVEVTACPISVPPPSDMGQLATEQFAWHEGVGFCLQPGGGTELHLAQPIDLAIPLVARSNTTDPPPDECMVGAVAEVAGAMLSALPSNRRDKLSKGLHPAKPWAQWIAAESMGSGGDPPTVVVERVPGRLRYCVGGLCASAVAHLRTTKYLQSACALSMLPPVQGDGHIRVSDAWAVEGEAVRISLQPSMQLMLPATPPPTDAGLVRGTLHVRVWGVRVQAEGEALCVSPRVDVAGLAVTTEE